MNRDAVRAALRDLARELAPLLPERAETIAVAFARARARPDDAGAREELRVLVHRMRGTAGSHGFDDLSREAGVIEDALLAADGGAVAEATLRTLAACVETIRAGAARAAHDASTEAL